VFRYPGGKLRLMKKINVLINNHYDCNSNWVVIDAFVGGGGSLINMANDFPKWSFCVNDSNKLVYKFWEFFYKATPQDIGNLYDKIRDTKPDIDLYNHIFDTTPTIDLDWAFKMIFLNKTSYNGYITQRLPIGGMAQKGNWKVDCYWNPTNMIKKIDSAYHILRNRIITVSMDDAVNLLSKSLADFVYADPPYLAYGQSWYDCGYTVNNLIDLRIALSKFPRWCISMDNNQYIDTIFHGDVVEKIPIIHTAKSSYSKGKINKVEEVVIFNV